MAVVVDVRLDDALAVAILDVSAAGFAAAAGVVVERNFPGNPSLTDHHWQMEAAVRRRVRQDTVNSVVAGSFCSLLVVVAAAAAVVPHVP